LGKIEYIDLFTRLTELEVLKYPPRFPYWAGSAIECRLCTRGDLKCTSCGY